MKEQENIELMVLELSEKYEAHYSIGTIIECLEQAIMSAVMIAYKKLSFVIWDGTLPRVYIADSRGFKEIEKFNRYIMGLIRKLFIAYLKRKASLDRIWTRDKKHGQITPGTVKDIFPDGSLLVDIEGIAGVVKKEDQIKKERSRYFEGARLFFYIKRVADMPDGSLGLLLSRNSRSLVTELIRSASVDIMNSFYERRGRNPVLFCSKRIAGYYSEIHSEILLTRDTLYRVRVLANDSRVKVKPFSIQGASL